MPRTEATKSTPRRPESPSQTTQSSDKNGKDSIVKEVGDCVILNDEDRLKNISPYIHSYWRDMSVKHGCLCIDEKMAIPKALKDAGLEDIHSTQPGSFAMLS